MRLSLTLSLYIARQFALAFVTVLMVIMGVIMLFDVIELIRRAAGRVGVDWWVLVGMALLKQPQMIHTIMPFAVMIGTMVAFWRLTRTHELVVARSAGISVWQFLTPVLVVVALIGVFEITAFNPLAARMYAQYNQMEQQVLLGKNNALDVSEVGLWLREGDQADQKVVHAEDVRQDGLALSLRDVHIFLYEGLDNFVGRIYAKSGRLEDGVIALQDVWRMESGRPSHHLDTLDLPTDLTLERVQDNFSSPETMSFWELPSFIHFFERAGFAAVKHRMYLQSLLASPLLYCAMVLVAAIFSLKPNNRSGGMLLRVGGGVAAGFAIYFLSKFIYAFGLSSTLPQSLAAWSPAFMAGLLGLSGLFHLEDG